MAEGEFLLRFDSWNAENSRFHHTNETKYELKLPLGKFRQSFSSDDAFGGKTRENKDKEMRLWVFVPCVQTIKNERNLIIH